jgi:hypothetical protein
MGFKSSFSETEEADLDIKAVCHSPSHYYDEDAEGRENSKFEFGTPSFHPLCQTYQRNLEYRNLILP